MEDTFHLILKKKIHRFILKTYDLTEQFPKSELYGTVSQVRRASVSVMLNFVEGFGRLKPKVKLHFWEISYGSARECKYLIFLAKEKKWITTEQYQIAFQLIDEIAAMLWKTIIGLEKTINSP